MSEPLIGALLQSFIALTGAVAFWMVIRPQETWSRWGYLLGFAGQPAWLYVTYVSGQFGMFAVSLAWTAVWGQGVWEQWLLPFIKSALESELAARARNQERRWFR